MSSYAVFPKMSWSSKVVILSLHCGARFAVAPRVTLMTICGMEEVTVKRWRDGPYSYEELECLFEGVWNPVRRFGV